VKPGWEIVRAGKTRLAPVIAKVEGAYEHSSLKGLVLRLAVSSRLQGFPGDDLEVEFRAADGKPIIKKIRLAQPKGTLSKFGFLPASYVWIDSKKLAGDIEYIQFNMFLDPAHLMARFADAVKSCLNCRGFVLDLRGNPGGIGAMAMGMASWFVDGEGERLGTLYLRDSKLSFVISPRPTVFAGPLAILVDETSASTSEILAGGLKDLKRAHIFGTRTAAAALPSAIEMLPNGDGFQYAMANYVSEGGKPLEGIGVSPDVEAPLTREALLAGKDPALDAAVNWIQSAKEGTSQ
jgi:carboxyl-terminal processing protease